MTSLPKTTHTPRCGWRHPHDRADGENVSKELQAGLALPTLCREPFWASEAALSLARLTCNLLVLFERHLGFWRFVTAGVLSHPAGQTTLKLAVPERERERDWRRPNCKAVENHPASTA